MRGARARLAFVLLALALFILPIRALGGGFADLNYAQSGTVWSTLGQLDRSRKDLVAMSRTLNPKFGSFEEAFSRLAVSVEGLASASGLLRNAALEVAGEAIGSGRVSNPVLPELRMNALMVGIVRLGLAAPWGGWTVRGGISFGFGPEQRSDAVSTDLIDEFEVREGMLALAGAELEARRSWEPWRRWTMRLQLKARETAFFSGTESAPLDFSSRSRFWALRWRAYSALTRSAGSWGSWGPEVILGPQPLPVEPLPQTWDYVHRVQGLGELGTLGGAGLLWQGTRGSWADWRLHAGFYGGYSGVGLEYRGRPWELAFGSWGVESSAAYRGLGQRLWQARVGLRL